MARPPEAKMLGRPPDSDGTRTRQEILDAALDLFATKGYGETTMREIGELVGVSDSAIYTYFDGKSHLYRVLLADAGPSVLSRVEPTLEQLAAGEPRHGLTALVNALMTEWDRPSTRKFTSVLLREELAGLVSALDTVRSRLVLLFETWRTAGKISSDFSSEELVWELIAPLAAIRLLYLNHQADPKQRTTGHRLAEQHLAYFLGSSALGTPD